MMIFKTYGYARVSTREQNEDRQLDALAEAGVAAEDIFVDKQSGKDFRRPEYVRLVRRLQPGDIMIVKSIDRLGRNYADIQNQWRRLTKVKGVDICVLDMPLLDTRQKRDLLGSFIADLVLQVLSFVAENERKNIRERQAEGIAAARARGVRFGRRREPVPDSFISAAARWRRGEISLDRAARLCGMARSTFYSKALAHPEEQQTAAQKS